MNWDNTDPSLQITEGNYIFEPKNIDNTYFSENFRIQQQNIPINNSIGYNVSTELYDFGTYYTLYFIFNNNNLNDIYIYITFENLAGGS